MPLKGLASSSPTLIAKFNITVGATYENESFRDAARTHGPLLDRSLQQWIITVKTSPIIEPDKLPTTDVDSFSRLRWCLLMALSISYVFPSRHQFGNLSLEHIVRVILNGLSSLGQRGWMPGITEPRSRRRSTTQ